MAERLPSADVVQAATLEIADEIAQMPLRFDRMRAHHWPGYLGNLGSATRLITSGSDPALAASVIAVWQALHYYQGYQAQAAIDTPELIQAFRKEHGARSDDETQPANVMQDYLGRNGDWRGYASRMARDIHAFLSLDDATPVLVGATKDGLCEAAECGLHCGHFDPVETLYTTDLHVLIEEYLGLDAVRARIDENPKKYEIIADLQAFDEPIMREEVPELGQMMRSYRYEATGIRMTLGLLRDVLAWAGSGSTLTYAEHLQS